jgi:hypothetical protein
VTFGDGGSILRFRLEEAGRPPAPPAAKNLKIAAVYKAGQRSKSK